MANGQDAGFRLNRCGPAPSTSSATVAGIELHQLVNGGNSLAGHQMQLGPPLACEVERSLMAQGHRATTTKPTVQPTKGAKSEATKPPFAQRKRGRPATKTTVKYPVPHRQFVFTESAFRAQSEVVDVARRSLAIVEEYLGEFRAVVLSGPRQLRHHQQGVGVEMSNRTFDDATELSAAIGDPRTYVEQLRAPTSVDEFQRADEPFLLLVKMRLDKDRSRGQLVLAGSTSFLTSKKVADSLAGRVGIVELWPFSVGEATGHEERFVDRAFHKPDQFHQLTYQHLSRADVAELIVRGGFPEPREMSTRARTNWFRSYLATIATKDVIEEVGEVRKLAEFRHVLELLIARTAHEANAAAIAGDGGYIQRRLPNISSCSAI